MLPYAWMYFLQEWRQTIAVFPLNAKLFHAPTLTLHLKIVYASDFDGIYLIVIDHSTPKNKWSLTLSMYGLLK